MKYHISLTVVIFSLFTPSYGITLARQSDATEDKFAFENRRICKFVLGLSIPIDVHREGVSMNWLTNIQSIFTLPENVERFEKKFTGGSTTGDMIKLLASKILDRNGLSDMETFQKVECEMQQQRSRTFMGLLDDLLQVTRPLFT